MALVLKELFVYNTYFAVKKQHRRWVIFPSDTVHLFYYYYLLHVFFILHGAKKMWLVLIPIVIEFCYYNMSKYELRYYVFDLFKLVKSGDYYIHYCACVHNRKTGMQWKTYRYQGSMLIFPADTGGFMMVMLLSLIVQRSGHVMEMPTFLSPGKPKSWKDNIFNAGWLIGVMHIRQKVVSLFLPSLNDALYPN